MLLTGVEVARWKAWPAVEKCLLKFSIIPGGAVVKGAVLQRQLCHQSPWVRAQALSLTGRDREVRGAMHDWPSVARVR